MVSSETTALKHADLSITSLTKFSLQYMVMSSRDCILEHTSMFSLLEIDKF